MLLLDARESAGLKADGQHGEPLTRPAAFAVQPSAPLLFPRFPTPTLPRAVLREAPSKNFFGWSGRRWCQDGGGEGGPTRMLVGC